MFNPYQIAGLEEFELFLPYPVNKVLNVLEFSELPDPHTFKQNVCVVSVPHLQGDLNPWDLNEFKMDITFTRVTFSKKRVVNEPAFRWVWTLPRGERFKYPVLKDLTY